MERDPPAEQPQPLLTHRPLLLALPVPASAPFGEQLPWSVVGVIELCLLMDGNELTPRSFDIQCWGRCRNIDPH